MWKVWERVPEPKSYEQVSLVKLTPGYVAGKSKRSGDWGKEGHIRAQLNIEQQQFSQPPKIYDKY